MFAEQDNYKNDLDYDTETSTDCDARGCYPDDYCRCLTIDGVAVKNNIRSIQGFFSRSYAKKKTDLDEVLDFWFTKRFFDKISWDYTAEADYYGENLSSIHIENDGDFFKRANGFCELTPKEKLHWLLTEEYFKVLDCAKDVSEWELKKVKIRDVGQSSNLNLLAKIKDDYSEYLTSTIRWSSENPLEIFKILAPLCLIDGKKYRILDGRHRFAAIASTFEIYDRKLHHFRPYTPELMYIICPKE